MIKCALIWLVALTGCDKEPNTLADAGAPPPPLTVTAASAEPLLAEGLLTAKGGEELHWKQGLDGSKIVDLALCGNRLYALSPGGRVVEWATDTHVPKQVANGFGAVTSIHANDQLLLAGTADGRLLHSGCDGREPKTSPEKGWPLRFVHLDPRSRNKRVFAIYEEPPTKMNKLEQTHMSVGLIDLDTGNLTREPFRTPLPEGARPSGFIDYKGELWFTLTPPKQHSKVWYLERFDKNQPTVAGLAQDDVIHGFVQQGRQVWAYGGAVDGSAGRIYRVDSNRAKPMWDGEEGWFGERPGGDLPTDPISSIHKRGSDLVIVASNAVYRADAELRRWKEFEANDPEKDVLRTATRAVAVGETIVIGTEHGLVAISDHAWERFTVPPSPRSNVSGGLETQIQWQGRRWRATKKGLFSAPADSERSKKVPRGPRGAVHALFVDQLSRMWVFGDDGIWLFRSPKKGERAHWSVTDVGLLTDQIRAIAQGGTKDSIDVLTAQPSPYRLGAPAVPVLKD